MTFRQLRKKKIKKVGSTIGQLSLESGRVLGTWVFQAWRNVIGWGWQGNIGHQRRDGELAVDSGAQGQDKGEQAARPGALRRLKIK